MSHEYADQLPDSVLAGLIAQKADEIVITEVQNDQGVESARNAKSRDLQSDVTSFSNAATDASINLREGVRILERLEFLRVHLHDILICHHDHSCLRLVKSIKFLQNHSIYHSRLKR